MAKSILLANSAIMAIGAMVPAAAAVAQTTAAPATAAGGSGAGLQEIVVTAQRRAENLQRAAIAVTALTADDLTRAGVTNSANLTNIAPALQVNSSFGATNLFYLRGVGNFVTNALSDTAVIVNVDGVPYGRPTSIQGMFFDLDRVEVLKGPQGTLYGRNATGGAINVITTKPKIGELSGYVNLSYGNYDARKATAAINAPLGDKSAIRIAGNLSKRDGNYSDGTGDEDLKSIRVALASELTDGIKIVVGADYTELGGFGAGQTVHGLDPDDRIGVSDPRARARYSSTFVFLAGDTLQPLNRTIYLNNDYWGIYAQADIETPVGTLTVLPAYRHAALDQRSFSSGFEQLVKEKDKQTSLEVRLASSDDGPFSYILGAFYFNETVKGLTNFNHQYFAPYLDFAPVTDSYAGFARLTYKLTDQFRISGGVRYTIDEKKARIDSINPLVYCDTDGNFRPPVPPTPQFCRDGLTLPVQLTAPAFLVGTNGIPQPFGPGDKVVLTTENHIRPSKTFRRATYRIGAEYDVAPRSMLYASFETGFKSGGFFSSIDDPSYKPEKIQAITIGSKNRFLDNRLQLNIELFDWTYKDQQVSHFRTNSVGGTEFVTENIGKTKVRGVEVEAQARVLDNTLLNFTVQYLDSEYKNFVYQNPAAVGPPVTGCAVIGPSGGLFTIDCSGRRPNQAPEWTLTAGVQQKVPLGEAGDLTFNLNTRYQSKTFVGFEQLPTQLQKGYFTSDAQVTYTLPGGRFTIGAFVNNIEDNNVVGFSSPHPRAASLILDSLRQPRTYGVRAGAKF